MGCWLLTLWIIDCKDPRIIQNFHVLNTPSIQETNRKKAKPSGIDSGIRVFICCIFSEIINMGMIVSNSATEIIQSNKLEWSETGSSIIVRLDWIPIISKTYQIRKLRVTGKIREKFDSPLSKVFRMGGDTNWVCDSEKWYANIENVREKLKNHQKEVFGWKLSVRYRLVNFSMGGCKMRGQGGKV